MTPPFQSLFAVPLECESCIEDVSKALYKLPGIVSVDADLAKQLVTVDGTVAPSEIVKSIQETGRDAILRGSGKPNSAAVAILETYTSGIADPVRGLARIVQVSPELTIIDLTVRKLSPGTYHATVRATGDMSQGAASTGGIWEDNETKDGLSRGRLGTVEVDLAGAGSVLVDKPMEVWELIGRSIVVSRHMKEGEFTKNDPDTIVGVIARSAGVWENDKMVCSCSGKSIWDERKENVGRGMV